MTENNKKKQDEPKKKTSGDMVKLRKAKKKRNSQLKISLKKQRTNY